MRVVFILVIVHRCHCNKLLRLHQLIDVSTVIGVARICDGGPCFSIANAQC